MLRWFRPTRDLARRAVRRTSRVPGVRHSAVRAPLLPFAALLITACSGVPAAEHTTTVAEPAAVEDVPAAALNIAVSELSEPDVVIGLGGTAAEDFALPLVAGQDSTRNIYVYDAILTELRRFDERGAFDRLLAKRGEGPGELRRSGATILVGAHGIRIWDARTGRVAHLAPDGALLDDVRTGFAPVTRRGATSLIHVYPDGSMLLQWVSERPPATGAGRGTMILRFGRATGGTVDSLYAFHRPTATVFVDGNRGHFMDPVPSAARMVFHDAAADELVQLDRDEEPADGEARFTVSRLTLHGMPTLSRRFAVPAHEFTSALRDSLRQQMALGASFGAAVNPRRLSEVDALTDWPRYMPPVAEADMSPDGLLWLKLAPPAGAAAAEWIALDPALDPVARIRLPADLIWVRFFADRVLASRHTAAGVPTIVGFNLPNR